MNKLLLAGVLALSLWAIPTEARAWGGPVNIQVNVGYSPYCCGGTNGSTQAGPWYLYFPYNDYFSVSGPTPFPYWPAPMTIQYSSYQGTLDYQGEAYQYGNAYYSQAPSYWYGR